MKTFCKHAKYKKIDWIIAPKYSTDEVLINVAAVTPEVEHYLIKFKDCTKYPEWFYMSGKVIRKQRKQANGNGQVYVVPMGLREEFTPLTPCEHDW